MKNRLNNILIIILWLLAVTLGSCFWFNIRYGFNIFSSRHWQYLAYMQASQQPIDSSFYMSIIVIIITSAIGLYILLQPRMRKIALPVKDVHNDTIAPVQTVAVATPQQSVLSMENTSVPQKIEQPVTTPEPVRPPRLNIPTIGTNHAITPRVPLTTSKPTQKFDPEVEYADIHEIFTNAGFVYKGAPRIKAVQTSVIAIGYDEVLWIGATGVKTADMINAVNTLKGVFTDTLEDIEINVNAFIIGAPDASENTDATVLQFATIDDLRSFITANPNTPSEDNDPENFDAYSAYIGTVIDYIGKI